MVPLSQDSSDLEGLKSIWGALGGGAAWSLWGGHFRHDGQGKWGVEIGGKGKEGERGRERERERKEREREREREKRGRERGKEREGERERHRERK